MKKIVITLLWSISIFVTIAICTATPMPRILGEGYAWRFVDRTFRINQYAFWWFTADNEGGFYDTMISFWPPRIQQSYMSKELRANIMLDDWQDPEIKAKRKTLHKIDDQKYWTWPDYYGLNESVRSGKIWGSD